MLYPGTILVTIILVALLIALPKRYFLVPFVIGACFVPADQRVIIFDLDFTPLRILIVVGVARLYMNQEFRKIRLNQFDKMFLLWAIVAGLIYIIQWRNMGAVIFRSGMLFDAFGLYWLFRQGITSWDDIATMFKTFAVSCLALCPFVAYEWATGSNPFEVMGLVATDIREGSYRCQASFPHAIMLGLQWATICPGFIGFARTGKNKWLFWSAVVACVYIIMATASSTPIMTLFMVLATVCLYRWRCYAGTAGWALLASLTALHIVMKAPVWHLISRINIVSGSTGWHRFNLIDQAVAHFKEWALIGCRSTAHWGFSLYDVTNQYVLEGVRGGLVSLVLFLAMIFVALHVLVRMSVRYADHTHRYLTWCLFVVMVGHCLSFFGVSYFGQIMMWWYMTLAFVGFVSESRELRPSVHGPHPGSDGTRACRDVL
jgi:hypothetical protein